MLMASHSSVMAIEDVLKETIERLNVEAATATSYDLLNFMEESEQADLSRLFCFLHVPDSLRGFYHASESIKCILDLLEELSKEKECCLEQVQSWKSVLGIFLSKIDELDEQLQPDFHSHDLRGILKKFPLYSALFYLSGSELYLHKQIIFPVLAIVFIRNTFEIGEDKYYQISKSIRYLETTNPKGLAGFENDENKPILTSIYENLSLKDSSKKLEPLLNSIGLKSAVKIIRNKGFINPRKSKHGIRGLSGKIKGRFPLVSVRGRLPQFANTELEIEEFGLVKQEYYFPKDIEERKDSDIYGVDVMDHVLDISISVPLTSLVMQDAHHRGSKVRPENEMDVRKVRTHAKRISESYIRAAQTLKTDTGLIDEFTLEQFLLDLMNYSEKKFSPNEFSPNQIPEPLIAAVLGVMLFRGRKIEVAISTRRTTLKAMAPGCYFLTSKQGRQVAFWSEESPLVTNNRASVATESVSSVYTLPINKWLTDLLIKAQDIRDQILLLPGNDSPELMESSEKLGFVWTDKDFKESIETYLSNLRRRHGLPSLSLGMIQGYLEKKALVQYDPVLSSYFTSKHNQHSHSQMHYTRCEISYLQSKYVELWDNVVFGMQFSNSDFEKINDWPRMDSKEYIGSKFCPKPEIIRELNQQLINDLSGIELESFKEIIEYHNSYSLYTLLSFSFATGYRGVHQVMPHWRLISPDMKFISISDKDDLDSTHARVVYLVERIRQQLLNYIEHVKALLKKLLEINFNLYKKVLAQLWDWLNAEEYRTSSDRFSLSEIDVTVFFHIDQKNKVSFLSLNNFFNSYKKNNHVDIPINAGRHALRSKLFQERVPSDVIDAFLGHFIQGLEPHSDYSAFSSSLLESELESIINNHMEVNGFELIKSRFV